MHFNFLDKLRGVDGNPLPMAERWARRTAATRDAIVAAGWRQIVVGGPMPNLASEVNALVVGFVLWSDDDVRLLDMLEDRLKCCPTQVFVFNMDDFMSDLAFEQAMPGVRPPASTPVLAEYRHGNVVKAIEGRIAVLDYVMDKSQRDKQPNSGGLGLHNRP